jgi:hypothetical protein
MPLSKPLTPAFLLLLAACGPPPATTQRALDGRVDVDAYALDNAKILAVSDAGRKFVAAIDQRGAFHLVLPTGARYRLTIANTLADRSSRVIAVLGWGPVGQRRHAISLAAGAAIDLGLVRPFAGTTLGTASSGSGESGSGSSSGGGDDDVVASGSPSATADDDDDDDEIGDCQAGADLPYDVRPPLGSSFQLEQAFLAKGPLPAAILEVRMDGGDWRLAELKANTAFEITQADCDHAGNRDVGRDRIFVTWRNADGSVETDHLDMRYCKDDGSGGGTSSGSTLQLSTCEDDGHEACEDGAVIDSDCEHSGGLEPVDDGPSAMSQCEPGGGVVAEGNAAGDASGPKPDSIGSQSVGGVCAVDGECAAGLACVASRCEPIVL